MSGYWVVPEETLRRLLKRAAAGEDPDMLLMEVYANAEHTNLKFVEREEDDGD